MKLINIIAFGLMVLMNYLANALPLNNKTTGELAGQYPNLFVPAGITFSIWSVIYLLLLLVMVLQFRDQERSLVAALGWAFAVSCVLNALWIVTWHYEMLPLSLIIMLGLLITLIVLNLRLTSSDSHIARAAFGVYLGWICIATIANATTLLVAYQWDGWGVSDEIWAIVMILLGTGIIALTSFRMQNPYIVLAAIWAFAGIIIKRQQDYTSIVIVAAIAIATLSVFLAYNLWYKKQIFF